MNFSAIIHEILQNQVVTGLSFTALAGGVMYQLRGIPHLLKSGMYRFFTIELSVLSSDPVFEWVDQWLAQQPYNKKTRMLRLKTMTQSDKENEWIIAPGNGFHVFFWHRRPIFMERSFLSKDSASEHSRSSRPIEHLHFRTLGRSQRIMRDLVEEARTLSVKEELVSVRIWTDYSWMQVRGKSQRSFDTITLKAGQFDRIIGDLTWFMQAADWYHQRGIPYRRGYCFSGPPGTGKTTVVLALAAFLKRPICVLNLNSLESDSALFEAIREAPINALILIEDVDCAYPAQSRTPDGKSEDGETERGISKAGLLNALDGVTTPDGRIFIMTTNFPDRLDPALVRPGRADVHETFDYFEADEQVHMARRFYDDFVPLPFAVSPAEMQAAFMAYADGKSARAHLLQKFNKISINDELNMEVD